MKCEIRYLKNFGMWIYELVEWLLVIFTISSVVYYITSLQSYWAVLDLQKKCEKKIKYLRTVDFLGVWSWEQSSKQPVHAGLCSNHMEYSALSYSSRSSPYFQSHLLSPVTVSLTYFPHPQPILAVIGSHKLLSTPYRLISNHLQPCLHVSTASLKLISINTPENSYAHKLYNEID